MIALRGLQARLLYPWIGRCLRALPVFQQFGAPLFDLIVHPSAQEPVAKSLLQIDVASAHLGIERVLHLAWLAGDGTVHRLQRAA